MPKYAHYAPPAGPDEPPNSNDRFDFLRWAADPTDDAPGIVRRHVAILTGLPGVSKTLAWKLAMASIRSTRPAEVTGPVTTYLNEEGRRRWRFRCTCGYDHDLHGNTWDGAGTQRTRKAHAALHAEQRHADRALVEQLAGIERRWVEQWENA